MSLLIPVLSKTPHLLKELAKALPNVNFHEVKDPELDPHFKQSEILICDFDLLAPHLYDLPETKWVQGTWAGIDKLTPVVDKNRPLPFQISRFTGEHFGRIMSEYVLAHVINHERNFLEIKQNQKEHQWVRDGKISDYRIISDLTMGILGLGSIGNRIGQSLHMLGAKILALGRKPELPGGDDYTHISKYHTKATLSSLLKECDYIISVLPSTKETDGLLDGDMLQNCDKQTVLINIGRSNIISEQSIIKAIDKKWLGAAILDVFNEEPLPATSPLWMNPQVLISPHVAGMTRAKDVAEQFRANLTLYLNKSPLPAIIDFNKGY